MYTKLSPQERLKDLRVVDKHLTLEQLEAQTGLSKAALGNYERKIWNWKLPGRASWKAYAPGDDDLICEP